jgi:hypothetical protein
MRWSSIEILPPPMSPIAITAKPTPKKKSFSPPETVREQPMARRVLRDHIAHEGKNRDCRAAVDEQAGSKNNLPALNRGFGEGAAMGPKNVMRPVGFLHVLSMQV